MFRLAPIARTVALLVLLGAGACSGSISCSGCGGSTFAPIPGGFDPAARIPLAAQVRVSDTGLGFIEREFSNLMSAYVSMTCGAADDIPCPVGFRLLPGGQANPSSCDSVQGVCVESATNAPGPLIGFAIDRTTQSNATICRDDPTSPTARACFAWLRFEGLALAPQGPNQVQATIRAQIDSTDIPIRYDPLGMDCLVRINSGASGSAIQDLVVQAELSEWAPPAGIGGRQLQVNVLDLTANIPDMDVEIVRDPVHGNAADILLCGFANLGPVKNALIPVLTGSLADTVSDAIDEALGWRCGPSPTLRPCPGGTTCNVDGFCAENAGGRVIPVELGFEGRLDFSALLGGLTGGRPGQGDMTFVVGGPSVTDAAGVTAGALAGAEVVTPDPTCAMVLPSPRLRPGFRPPAALPSTGSVDLDFNGSLETPYMVAAGVSQAFFDQIMWTVYTTGLLCGRASSYDVGILNTGSLGLLIPSLSQLTHEDKYPWAIYPVRLSLRPRAEPRIILGSGEVSGDPANPNLVDPLFEVFLDDLEISFTALVEDRWVRLMTITADVHLGLGAIVNASNEIQLVLGDLGNSVADVRVRDNEILAENPMELADAIPALLELALPSVTGVIPSFALPSAADLGGFDLTVLGIRGVDDGGGVYRTVAVYADLDFDPSQVPNLSFAANTHARISSVMMPSIAELAVTHPGGPRAPEVVIELGGEAPVGAQLEHQIRVDRGMWSPFFQRDQVVLRRPDFAVQGWHSVEVRARVVGDYRSLDSTPVVLDVLIDPEAPRVLARLAVSAGGLFLEAYDVVDGDAVKLEVAVDGKWSEVTPDAEGFVVLPAVNGPAGIAVSASDRSQNRTVRELRAAPEASPTEVSAQGDQSAGGCTCLSAGTPDGMAWLAALPLLLLLRRRRR